MKFVLSAAILSASLLATGGANAASTIQASKIDVNRAGVAGQGFEAEAHEYDNSRTNPANALGAPDQTGTTASGFYSLGKGGIAVFGFDSSFSTSANVFEVSFGCSNAGLCSGYPEQADVYALNGDYTAFDGAFDLEDLTTLGFTKIGTVLNGDANGANGAAVTFTGPFKWLALVDGSNTDDGFDVDAVSVSAVPLPASFTFLLASLGGLGLLRSRHPGRGFSAEV